MRMLGFSGETHGPKLAELPIWSFCWIQTFNKKHADESICRILSGHCQPSIRPVLFPNTICEFKEITGLSYMSDTPMAQNQVPPPKKNMILYIDVMILYIIYRCLSSFPPFKLKFVVYPQGPHSNPCGHQVACQPLWRCEGTISAWGRDRDAREQFQPGAETVVLQQHRVTGNDPDQPGQWLHSSLGFHLIFLGSSH